MDVKYYEIKLSCSCEKTFTVPALTEYAAFRLATQMAENTMSGEYIRIEEIETRELDDCEW